MGLFIGASLLAPLADKLGRRLTFMFALAWYGVFSLMMACKAALKGLSSAAFWSASVSALSW
ncbi:transporter [Klebsiella michiganensis]|uniref:Transporter n=1 Tax=Klebsiella michiganensis TaxID=1134687 RepID=A0A7H4LT19_9ENTR|nr:transporter [Klebsiella michiganensis]